MAAQIVAVSTAADFDPEGYPAGTCEWSFMVSAKEAFGAGVYRIEFVRILTPEERTDFSLALKAEPTHAP